jgi:hypothetical protein
MISGQKSHWSFKGFLAGVVIGSLFGLVTSDVLGGPSPARAQISVGFWGLIGGLMGLMTGAIYSYIKKK